MKIKNLITEIIEFENGGEERLVEAIYCEFGMARIATVGSDGVTKIVLYRENGQMDHVPWAAIYKGDFLWQRVDLAGMRIIYKE